MKLELLLLLRLLLFELGGWSRLLGDRPSLMRLVRLMLCLLCGAKAPSMQDPGVIRWVGLKEMGILFYLCNAIYIAYVSMVR